MSVKEFREYLKNNIDEIKNNRVEETLIITLDLIALVKLRLQSQGTDYTGSAFSPYSPQYADYRQKKGRQVGFVDFTFTGRMLASLHPVVKDAGFFSCKVEIEARTDEEDKKLQGQFPKRGNILRPSEDELAFVRQANRERIFSKFK